MADCFGDPSCVGDSQGPACCRDEGEPDAAASDSDHGVTPAAGRTSRFKRLDSEELVGGVGASSSSGSAAGAGTISVNGVGIEKVSPMDREIAEFEGYEGGARSRVGHKSAMQRHLQRQEADSQERGRGFLGSMADSLGIAAYAQPDERALREAMEDQDHGGG